VRTGLIDFYRILLLFRMLSKTEKDNTSRDMCCGFMPGGLTAAHGGQMRTGVNESLRFRYAR
jgi:hypothetical protein